MSGILPNCKFGTPELVARQNCIRGIDGLNFSLTELII
ncbi:Uncharacterized protein dnm_097540 [Desulfonema magnum]|uniref:Uncharacterized protein n=1 Tax=Desulfonema magnum TaxID=45655 RepID=A0A975BXW8_9BACT|nr:Uncharacterized protein dnm_097540 [Desulfonema magnum]